MQRPFAELTFNVPIKMSVGSSPTEKINLKMVEAMNVRIPEGRGKVMTIARDTNMAVHTNPDNQESKSEKCIQII